MAHLPSWFPVLLVLVISLGLVGVILVATHLLGPRRMNPVKAEPFECGSPSTGLARDRFGVKFYVIALLFIVFDVEAVFVYPWAVLFKELAWPGFITMAVFVFTLVIGLVYVWKKGALEWE
jgi:NADH-quinone oxidoreductase subunit A